MFTKRLILVAAGLITAFGLLFAPKGARAAVSTFTVTNTNASGAGSFSQAIIDANGNGNSSDQDVINFAIATSGNITITPDAGVDITQSVLINGYTQSDSRANTASAPNPFDGILRVAIDVSTSGALHITGSNVTLQGLVINNGQTGSVFVDGASGFKLRGSYLDTQHDGFTPVESLTRVRSLVIENSANAAIGGSDPAYRNLFGYCQENCILAEGSGTIGLTIKGNYIGLAADGVASLHGLEVGGVGIQLDDNVAGAVIGGSAAGEGNSVQHNLRGAIQVQDSSDISILGNRILANYKRDNHGTQGLDAGIYIGGSTNVQVGSSGGGRNIIAGNQVGSMSVGNSSITNNPSSDVRIINNYFGVMEDGTSPFPNFLAGLVITDDSQYVLVQDNLLYNNQTDSNTTPGVRVLGLADSVSILHNSIYNNDGIGISVENSSAPAAPGYRTISESDGDTNINFTADLPAGDWRVEFYQNDVADPSGAGEGQTYIGMQDITSAGSGLRPYSATLIGTGYTNIALTATKIDPESPGGFGATTQFGALGEEYIPPPANNDLAISLSIQNPEDIKLNRQVTYDVQFTNNGPDTVNLTSFDGSTDTNHLAQIVLPAGFSFSSATNSDVTCTDLGEAGTAVGYLQNHADSKLVDCEYVGASHNVTAGQSISFSVVVDVTNDSAPQYSVYVLGGAIDGDPHLGTLSSGLQDIDMIDYFGAHGVNNFTVQTDNAPAPINTDMSLSIQAQDSSVIELGGSVTYQATITNNGGSAIDLRNFDGSHMAQDQLAEFYLPPQLQYVSASGTSISCTNNGAGSAGTTVTYLQSHQDYDYMNCVYTGGKSMLAVGDSVVITINALIVDDSNLLFNIYGVGGDFAGDGNHGSLETARATPDLVDYFSETSVNNFAIGGPSGSDAALSLELDNPGDVADGASLSYTASLTNNGPWPIATSLLSGQEMNPLADPFFMIIPPNLEFVSNDNPDIFCSWQGPGSADLVGAQFFTSHPNSSLAICVYTGTDAYLMAGQSLTTHVIFTYTGEKQNFDLYAIGGADPTYDAGAEAIFSAFTSGNDIIDSLLSDNPTNNFAQGSFRLPLGSSGGNNSSGGDQSPQSLAGTGDSQYTVLGAALALILLGIVVAKRRRPASSRRGQK